MNLGRPFTSIIEEAERVLKEAFNRNITLRLLGGTAVKLVSKSSWEGPLSRPAAQDLDFVGLAKQSRLIKELFQDLGYEPNRRFNALHGRTRLQFIDQRSKGVYDVFLDLFHMCHTIRLKDRLHIEEKTIPIADLLLTKLQVVELNEKDVKDILAIVSDCPIGGQDKGMINVDYISRLCSKDWGLYRTVTDTLSKAMVAVDDYPLSKGMRDLLKDRLKFILDRINQHPKSLRWKVRALMGKRMAWYDEVEAPVREPWKKKVYG